MVFYSLLKWSLGNELRPFCSGYVQINRDTVSTEERSSKITLDTIKYVKLPKGHNTP